jgi:hypothetical protein
VDELYPWQIRRLIESLEETRGRHTPPVLMDGAKDKDSYDLGVTRALDFALACIRGMNHHLPPDPPPSIHEQLVTLTTDLRKQAGNLFHILGDFIEGLQ